MINRYFLNIILLKNLEISVQMYNIAMWAIFFFTFTNDNLVYFFVLFFRVSFFLDFV